MHISGSNGSVELLGVKPAAVAGSFYPGDTERLRTEVDALLAGAPPGPPPKALIAPHAGYVYSGPVAATVYARLAAARGQVRRVVLIGPSHHVALSGLATSSAGLFETPLGRIAVDRDAVALALKLPGVQRNDAAFAREHSLEVHLPFLQRALGNDFRLAPFVAGDADPEIVGGLLDALWGGPETCLVVSSDLSHYLDYDRARQVDAATTAAIEALRPAALDHHGACGCTGVRGLLRVARARSLRVETVDVRNSGDTAGPRDRVVGYGAWAFTEAPAATLSLTERRVLLGLAASSIRHGLDHDRAREVAPGEVDAALMAPRATFVTLECDGRLRGCIGNLRATRALAADVAANAYAAAFRDPRFEPLGAEEFERTSISISVLSPMQPMEFDSEQALLAQLRPGIDGLLIEDRGRSATFLPAVWDSIPEPARFLGELRRKAGLAADHWSADFRASRYTTESFS